MLPQIGIFIREINIRMKYNAQQKKKRPLMRKLYFIASYIFSKFTCENRKATLLQNAKYQKVSEKKESFKQQLDNLCAYMWTTENKCLAMLYYDE